MAIIDVQNTFAETIDLDGAAAASTTPSTNVYDTGTTVGKDFGVNWSEQLVFELICTEDVDEAVGGATLTINLVSSAAAGLGTPNIHWTTGALDATTASNIYPITAGNRLLLPFPAGGGLDPDILQFIGFTFVVAAQALNAGKFNIHMGRGFHMDKAFSYGWNFA